jgi:hypothetical protein
MNQTERGFVFPQRTNASNRPTVAMLPSEILSHIFILGAKSNDPIAYTNFELWVSHVSHYWRAVSLGTQDLWGTVSVHMPLERVSIYLDRSKVYRLTILICPRLGAPKKMMFNTYISFTRCLNVFLKAVAPAACRWHTLVVRTYDHVAMTHVLDRVMRLSVPQLESLELTQQTIQPPSVPVVSGDIFRSFLSCAHSLSLVRFDLVHLPWISFSATNLRGLDIGRLSPHISMSYDQLHQLLTVSPRLVKLALTGGFYDVEDYVAYPPIVLPTLRHLRISSPHQHHAGLPILHLLSTSALKSLEINQVRGLNAFICNVNSNPPKYHLVTSLILNDIHAPLENTDIFSVFPSVSYFDILGCDTRRMFESWSRRVVHPDKSVVWPDLHTLVIDRMSSSGIALTRIIKFRKKYGRPLVILSMTDECRARYSTRIMEWLDKQVAVDIITQDDVPDVWFDYEVDREPEFDPDEEMYDPNDPYSPVDGYPAISVER